MRPGVRCPTGEARLTPGFRLPARWVIHTVGPVYRGPESAGLLHASYQSSLAIATAGRLATIAFPAISCGVYGYPLDEAAAIAVEQCIERGRALATIWFVLYDEAPFQAWRAAAAERLEQS